jgi:hypothetical protein
MAGRFGRTTAAFGTQTWPRPAERSPAPPLDPGLTAPAPRARRTPTAPARPGTTGYPPAEDLGPATGPAATCGPSRVGRSCPCGQPPQTPRGIRGAREPVAGTGLSAILPAVEQRTGPITPPMHAAGTDPAFIPGLTPPHPAQEAVEDAEGPDAEAKAAEVPADQPTEHPAEDAASGEEAEGTSAEDSAAEPAEASEGEAETEAAEEAEAPVFEVSDRRGSIVADRTGIRFRLDEEHAEFGWDEIGAVETGTPRFGRRFTVTVYTTNRHWYEADVEAPAKSLLKEWTSELDAVLDAWFENAESEQDAESEEKAESDQDATSQQDTAPKPDSEPEDDRESEQKSDSEQDAASEQKSASEQGTESEEKAESEPDIEPEPDTEQQQDAKLKSDTEHKPDTKLNQDTESEQQAESKQDAASK